jgi:2-C-methyl-D-erythritol 2,4-cyclodiphosphate synthase
MIRMGIGYDSHRLAVGRPLILGGVTIPHSAGLIGHSDADAVSHALADALLGAMALGDIGRHFPDSDPAWRDADSIDLLHRVAALVRQHGGVPVQADITVIAQEPKLAPYHEAMAARLATAIGVGPGMIGLKAKTNEGMGFTGRGEGIAVLAVATVEAS